jgi:TRAP-type mannitol/chloroaromatic compound transport system permease large subunit
MISIFIFSVFLVMLLVLRVPIAFAMIISAASAIYIWDIVPINFLVQTVYTAGENFTLLAIPFFVLSGDLIHKHSDYQCIIAGNYTGFGRCKYSPIYSAQNYYGNQ